LEALSSASADKLLDEMGDESFRGKALNFAGAVVRAAVADPHREFMDEAARDEARGYTELMNRLAEVIDFLRKDIGVESEPQVDPLGIEGFYYRIQFEPLVNSWSGIKLRPLLDRLEPTHSWSAEIEEIPVTARVGGTNGERLVQRDMRYNKPKYVFCVDEKGLDFRFAGAMLYRQVEGKPGSPPAGRQVIHAANLFRFTSDAWRFVVEKVLRRGDPRGKVQWRAGVYRSGGSHDTIFLPRATNDVAPGTPKGGEPVDEAGCSQGFELAWQEAQYEDPADLARETVRQVHEAFQSPSREIPR
jgi:hypothetical protein